MIEVQVEETERIEMALRKFKKKVQKSGILKELRRTQHYTKPSTERQLKAAAARRRGRTRRPAA